MFNPIPQKINSRMSYLENLDKNIRNGTSDEAPLYQISRDSGKFLCLAVSLSPMGRKIEIGTSGGYSGLWISLACGKNGEKFTTFEINEESYKRALETFKTADVMSCVEPINGDAKDYIADYDKLSFCYLDGGDYCMFYDLVIPKLIKGGVLVADNMIIPKGSHDDFVAKALNDNRIDAVVVPIGTGMLFGIKI